LGCVSGRAALHGPSDCARSMLGRRPPLVESLGLRWGPAVKIANQPTSAGHPCFRWKITVLAPSALAHHFPFLSLPFPGHSLGPLDRSRGFSYRLIACMVKVLHLSSRVLYLLIFTTTEPQWHQRSH
jgi:hypothetical protein